MGAGMSAGIDDSVTISQAATGRGPVTAAQAWAGLRTATSRAEFYRSWLALLCGGVRRAESGLLLVRDEEGAYVPAAIWPGAETDPTYLGPSAERALVERRSIVAPYEGRSLVAYPIVVVEDLVGVVVVDHAPAREDDNRVALEQIAWACGWPEAMYWRHHGGAVGGHSGTDPETGKALVLDVLRAADQHDRFDVAAVLVANRIATQLACDRVSIGLIGRKGLQIRAISHSATFDRKSELVSGLEAAMQECFDQSDAVAYPPVGTTARRISVAHAEFVERWGIGSMVSVLLIAAGRPIGVITLERPASRTFDAGSLQAASDLAEALGAVIDLKFRQSKLISGRLLDTVQDGLSTAFGPERLSIKLAAAAVAILLPVLAFWPAQFRVSAKSVLEGTIQRAAVAPFDGFVAKAPHRAGDIVREGEELAALDDRDLLLEKLKWETERQKLVQRQRDAMAKHDRINLILLVTQLEQAQTQLDLVLEKLKRARITAPINGVVVSGDLSQMLGAPVQQGKVLFEIAPLSSYRLIVQVDERDIGYIKVGHRGTLLLTGAASEGIPLEVTKLTSVSTPEDGRNYFRVEASIASADPSLRPGMEGIAKIEVGKGSVMWIWTRPLIERIRMFLWMWAP